MPVTEFSQRDEIVECARVHFASVGDQDQRGINRVHRFLEQCQVDHAMDCRNPLYRISPEPESAQALDRTGVDFRAAEDRDSRMATETIDRRIESHPFACPLPRGSQANEVGMGSTGGETSGPRLRQTEEFLEPDQRCDISFGGGRACDPEPAVLVDCRR